MNDRLNPLCQRTGGISFISAIILMFYYHLKMQTMFKLFKKKTYEKTILTQFVILVLSVCQASGQSDTFNVTEQKTDTPNRILTLFDTDEPLEISLEFDLKHYMEKTAKTEIFDGLLTMLLSEADSMDRKITMKYRGESRYLNCGNPPLEITFKKPVYLDSDSGRVKKIKLVHQCQKGSLYEEYIKREYLVYKLYNVLTDTSFRVRMLKINYIDTKKARKPFTLYGFFIEPKTILAGRTNTLVLKTKSLTQRDMIPETIDRIAIFNYMIANWDWSVPGQHNVDILKSSKYDVSGLGIPVPFDFDLAGVVGADYAIPPPELELENKRERLFAGICRTREVYQKELLMFLSKKEQFYSVINEYPYLSKASKKDITVLLDQFFGQIEKQRSLNAMIDLFMEKCKKL